jgi:hypothetical protein
MKLTITLSIAFTIVIAGQIFAQDPMLAPLSNGSGPAASSHAVGLASDKYTTNNTGIGTNSQNANGVTPKGTPDESATDEDDDMLYRGKTSDSEVPMLRDDGALHFKTRPKEKAQEVDSTKKLQSKATDKKFQGSLLHSSVTSIEDITAKDEAAATDRDDADNVDPRFKPKQLTFTPEKDDKPKKSESSSSPTPTPSATASPQKQKKDPSQTDQ